MNLLFIYGPPAVGKTTVGRELADLTGYKLFHNHLTVPAAKALFPDSHGPHYDKRYTNLLHKLRLDALSVAAEAGLDVIFTLAYSGAVDDSFVEQIVHCYTSKGGDVHFVELHAPQETLLRRVNRPSRIVLGMGKMTDPNHLQQVLDGRDMSASVKYPDIVKIDTSQTEPQTAAQHIIEHFNLR